jgi:hypothetical protein
MKKQIFGPISNRMYGAIVVDPIEPLLPANINYVMRVNTHSSITACAI